MDRPEDIPARLTAVPVARASSAFRSTAKVSASGGMPDSPNHDDQTDAFMTPVESEASYVGKSTTRPKSRA